MHESSIFLAYALNATPFSSFCVCLSNLLNCSWNRQDIRIWKNLECLSAGASPIPFWTGFPFVLECVVSFVAEGVIPRGVLRFVSPFGHVAFRASSLSLQ
jgi:hypothetical protein